MNTLERPRTGDASRAQRERERQWKRSKRAEGEYGRKLRGVAEQIDKLVRGIDPEDMGKARVLENALREYSRLIRPWAVEVAGKMISETERRDVAMWQRMSEQMGPMIRAELRNAPTGQLLRDMLAENVDLITSIPLDAAARVHKLALDRVENSGRAAEISAEIMRTGHVSRSRATLIARTEVARVASGLVEARSIHVGSEGYIWRTSKDADVRNRDGNPVGSHRLLEGKFIRWDSPPVASTDGTRAHAGQIYNCRCYPEPVIPDRI